MDDERNIVGDYELFDKIGQGSFAQVWEGLNKKTGCPCAVKQFRKDTFNHEAAVSMNREIGIMQLLDHPLIAQLYEVIERDDGTFLFMELVENGTLLEYINKNAPINENRARIIFAQIVAVLDYLHNEKRVVHRDLKAENILIDENDNIRVIDFGLSNILNQNTVLYTACGSSAYVAPEMLLNKPYTQAADIWSAGVLLYAMNAAHLPFEDQNVTRLVDKVLNRPPDFPVYFSKPLCDLISKMLTKNPEQRITLEGIKIDPWFTTDSFGSVYQYNFAALNKYKLMPNPPNMVLDEEVVQRMQEFGIDTTDLKRELTMNNMNSLTAAYKSIHRELFRERGACLTDELITTVSRPFSMSSINITKRVLLSEVQPSKNATDTRLNQNPQNKTPSPLCQIPSRTGSFGNASIPKIPSRTGSSIINLIVPTVKGRGSSMQQPTSRRIIVNVCNKK